MTIETLAKEYAVASGYARNARSRKAMENAQAEMKRLLAEIEALKIN